MLRVKDAERAAQINIDRGYRTLTRKGEKKKPHKVWIHLEPSGRKHKKVLEDRHLIEKEREILGRGAGEDAWGNLK